MFCIFDISTGLDPLWWPLQLALLPVVLVIWLVEAVWAGFGDLGGWIAGLFADFNKAVAGVGVDATVFWLCAGALGGALAFVVSFTLGVGGATVLLQLEDEDQSVSRFFADAKEYLENIGTMIGEAVNDVDRWAEEDVPVYFEDAYDWFLNLWVASINSESEMAGNGPIRVVPDELPEGQTQYDDNLKDRFKN